MPRCSIASITATWFRGSTPTAALAEPLTVRDDLPALYQLLPQVAAAAAAVQAALGTAGDGDPHGTGTGRANLEAVQARAQRLAATGTQALADERP